MRDAHCVEVDRRRSVTVSMKRRPLAPPLAVVWTIVLGLQAGCTGGSTAPAEPRPKIAAQPHSDEPAHEALPRRVRLSPEVVAAAGIRTAPIAREALVLTVPLPGEIVADPDRTARVASPIAGRIERVAVREGSAVKKGEIVAMIRVPDLGRLRATLSATLAQGQGGPRQRGAPQGARASSGSRRSRLYLDALAAAEALELEVRAVARAARGAGPRGRCDGALAAHAARAARGRRGEPQRGGRSAGDAPTRCSRTSSTCPRSGSWAACSRRTSGGSRPDAPAEVQLNAYPQRALRRAWSSTSAARSIPVARTVTARIRLQNRDDLLRVGLFGTAYVIDRATAAARQPTLVVPRSALTEVAGKPVVFVRQADHDFELHEVVLGDSAAGKVQVLAGLREGEQVVVEGVFTLKSAVLEEHVRRGRVAMALLSRDRRLVAAQSRRSCWWRRCCSRCSGCARRSACRSTRCPTSPTCRCRSSPPRPRSRRSRSSSTSPCRSSARWPASPRPPRCAPSPSTASRWSPSSSTTARTSTSRASWSTSACARRRTPCPRSTASPSWAPSRRGLGEIFQFTVRNERLTLMQLEELLDWQIGPQLRTVPGVVEVNSFGGEDRQYQVVLDPKRLQAAGISVAQVVEALEQSQRQRGRRLHRAQPRALRDRHRRPGQEPRRPASAW